MFAARPPAGPPSHRELGLVRAARRSFTGPAEYLADPGNRAQVSEYLADLAGPGQPLGPLLGQSYGEMGRALIESAVPADEPVDLLILAFSVHDLRPGRQSAAYLSHVTPGTPTAFAICDQGSAAAFSGLRIAREYAALPEIERILLIVVEQAALPYGCLVPLPKRHQGVAMLLRADAAEPMARVIGGCQHGGVEPAEAARLAEAGLARLTGGQEKVTAVVGDALAGVWKAPGAGRVRVTAPGQPATGVWWELLDGLADHPGVVVAADYDSDLRYLSLAAFDTASG